MCAIGMYANRFRRYLLARSELYAINGLRWPGGFWYEACAKEEQVSALDGTREVRQKRAAPA